MLHCRAFFGSMGAHVLTMGKLPYLSQIRESTLTILSKRRLLSDSAAPLCQEKMGQTTTLLLQTIGTQTLQTETISLQRATSKKHQVFLDSFEGCRCSPSMCQTTVKVDSSFKTSFGLARHSITQSTAKEMSKRLSMPLMRSIQQVMVSP